jgi:hypothetical protein
LPPLLLAAFRRAFRPPVVRLFARYSNSLYPQEKEYLFHSMCHQFDYTETN